MHVPVPGGLDVDLGDAMIMAPLQVHVDSGHVRSNTAVGRRRDVERGRVWSKGTLGRRDEAGQHHKCG